MKKFMLSFLVLGLVFILYSPTVAKKEPEKLPAPVLLECGLDYTLGDSVCIEWEAVAGATKYSVDVEVEVDGDEYGVADTTVEFSFGTGDRTGGLAMDAPSLCVPLSEFVYDIDGDGILDPVSGPATAKVKGLNPPGKINGRQNHPFSIKCEFLLP
jgi:hypothetical protein